MWNLDLLISILLDTYESCEENISEKIKFKYCLPISYHIIAQISIM